MDKDQQAKLHAVATAAKELQRAMNEYGKPLDVRVRTDILAPLGFEEVAVFQIDIVREERVNIHP